MPKQSGLGDAFYVDGVDLSGDTASLGSIHGGPAALDFTAIDKSAMERQGGLRDGEIEWTSFFNPTAGQAHPTLSALPYTNRIITYVRGPVLGANTANLIGKQIDYAPTRSQAGELTMKVNAVSDGFGIEWGTLHTNGKRTDGGAANGTPVDGTGGASSTFGLQAYLQVFAFTGTSVVIKLQESSDNGADAYADVVGGAFTSVTAGPGSQRIATAGGLTVERYLRVVTVGTFSNLQFTVSVCRNPVSVVF